MQDKHREKFNEWWAKYQVDPHAHPTTLRKAALAAWNAAGHLLAFLAREEGRKERAEIADKYSRLKALNAIAMAEIDELGAKLKHAPAGKETDDE